MKRLLYLTFILFFITHVSAQVGINTETPNDLSALDVENLTIDGNKINKGILIPRMTTIERDQILAGKSQADSISVGSLLVYNLDEECFNYYHKTDREWKSLCGQLGRAQFTVTCEESGYNGEYGTGIDLNANNYLTLAINVTREGSYEIFATSLNQNTNNENGYFFTLSGQFLSKGIYTIRVPGYGKPIAPSNNYPELTNADIITISSNEVELCTLNIPVKDNSKIPAFTIDCGSISLNPAGKYVTGQSLDASNTITLNIRFDTNNPDIAGSIYEIKTDIINGYSFYAQGTIDSNSNTQQVTLSGEGTPLMHGTDNFIFYINSTLGKANCSKEIKVATRVIKVIGASEASDWDNLSRSTSRLKLTLENPKLFGNNQDALFPVAGFNFVAPVYEANMDGTLANVITNNPDLDIIFVQYNWVANNTADLDSLVSFVNRGGVLIYCTDGGAAASGIRNQIAQRLVNRIFYGAGNDSRMTATGTHDGDNYATFSVLDTGTLITEGPFMNLIGRHIGRDATNNFDFDSSTFDYDLGTVLYYSFDKNAADPTYYIRAFMHKTKGFAFFSDGAPFALAHDKMTTAYEWTAKVARDGNYFTPISNSLTSPITYNSHLFCNIMAWAIDYRQRNNP